MQNSNCVNQIYCSTKQLNFVHYFLERMLMKYNKYIIHGMWLGDR